MDLRPKFKIQTIKLLKDNIRRQPRMTLFDNEFLDIKSEA